jgi:hypothetical protein
MKINSLTMVYPDPFCDNWHKDIKTYIVTWDTVRRRKVKRTRDNRKIISIKPF